MKNNTEKDSSSLYSSTKTNSSSKNEDIFPKQRPRAGIKSKVNNFQAGRHTVAVPLNSFSGISHNASFQSKLKFFNNGKPAQKFQHMPIAHDKVISEENDKKENMNIKKIAHNKEDKNKKIKNEKDDIDCNMNINKIIESKNNNSNNSNNINNTNKNNEENNNNIYSKNSKESYLSSELKSENENESENNNNMNDSVEKNTNKEPNLLDLHMNTNKIKEI